MNVTVNGSPVSVDVAGAGEATLFVHGFPLDRRMWRAQVSALADTHRMIVPDLRGFGASRSTSTSMTMDAYADDLAELLDTLDIDEPVNLCGLSMGGYIAFAFFRRHPQRLRRLIFCDTKSEADPPQKITDRERMADDVLKNGTDALARNMPASLLAETTHSQRPEIVAAVRSMITDASPAGVATALRAMADRGDATALLPRIDVPTLVVCGSDDPITPPAEMRRLAERIPHATFVEIPAAGHLSPMENPDAFNEALRTFLQHSPAESGRLG